MIASKIIFWFDFLVICQFYNVNHLKQDFKKYIGKF